MVVEAAVAAVLGDRAVTAAAVVEEAGAAAVEVAAMADIDRAR